MASKRRLRRKGCGDKIKYTSQIEADKVSDRSARQSGALYNVYKCNFCSSYHVGHMNYKARREHLDNGLWF